ncbi:hypothetical protein [Pseudomonas sp. JUb96]|uniref:hypothetical protein n=1 Tax=Pseudomonas sp. JUb96 TaxID=2940539 RepID=UPI002227CD2E|nr:hypothetical protein [Pseudomonas sp. JUb96]MCW2267599.1 hypothetical protein [Pseudomonas sp. JUb96]
MKLRAPIALAFLTSIAAAGAATPPPPALILCSPDEHYRAGIETLDVAGTAAHLFEYGGKVTVTKSESGDQEHYSYGEGQDFYTLREKTAYLKDFVDLRHGMFLYSGSGLAGSNGLPDSLGDGYFRESMGSGFFHIDWTKRRYYGYTPESGAVHSYAGSCVVLKR